MIANGLDPFAVAEKISTFTPDTQLARVYRMHHELQHNEMSALRGRVKFVIR